MKKILDFLQISKKLFIIFLVIGFALATIMNIIVFSDDVSYYNYEYFEDHEHDKRCFEYEYRDNYWKYDDDERYMDCPAVLYDSGFETALNEGYTFGFDVSQFLGVFFGFEILVVIVLLIIKSTKTKNKKEKETINKTTDILD